MKTHEFSVAHPLSECVERLTKQSGGIRSITHKWQSHADIYLKEVDAKTYRLTMRGLGANAFVEIQGSLRTLDSEHSFLSYQGSPPTSFFLRTGASLLAVLFILPFPIFLTGHLYFSEIRLIWQVFGFAILILVGMGWRYTQLIQNQLVRTLEQALED